MKISINKINKNLWYLVVICLLFYCLTRLLSVFVGVLSLGYIKFTLLTAVSISLLMIFIKRDKSYLVTARESATLLLFVLMVISTFVQMILFQDIVDFNGRSAHQDIFEKTIYSISWAFIGYAITLVRDLEHKNWLGIVIMSLLTFLIIHATKGGLVINYANFTDQYESTGASGLNHASIDIPVYLLLIVSYSLLSDKLKVYIIPFSLFILFAIGGRTDLVLYILSLLIYEYLRGILNLRLLIIIAALLSAILIVPLLGQLFPDNLRQISRITFSEGVTEDSSFQARILFFNKTLETLPSQFLFGDSSEIVRSKGAVGTYSHNLFSAWEYYGFFVFILISSILLANFRRIVYMAKYLNSPLTSLMIFIYFTTVIGVLVSKNVSFIFLWICIGMLASDIGLRKNR